MARKKAKRREARNLRNRCGKTRILPRTVALWSGGRWSTTRPQSLPLCYEGVVHRALKGLSTWGLQYSLVSGQSLKIYSLSPVGPWSNAVITLGNDLSSIRIKMEAHQQDSIWIFQPNTTSHHYTIIMTLASLVAQTVKNLLAIRETWVWSLGQEDPLEKAMAFPLQ